MQNRERNPARPEFTAPREAWVAVQTIDNSAGNKAAIRNTIRERVVTGTDATVTVSQILSARVAAASIRALGHPDVYTALVVEASWTVDACAKWVSHALAEGLIP